MSDITRICARIEAKDPTAADELLPLVYDELRKLAAARLAQEKPGQTLQATALVHEAYLRLVGGRGDRSQGTGNSRETSAKDLSPDSCRLVPSGFDSRGHFFAAAAEAMRRILIEQARRKRSLKAGGSCERRVPAEMADLAEEAPSDAFDLLALDEAMQKLERQSPRKAELVKLRFFAGLTIDQAAEALGVAPSTANADWLYAKSWLHLEMRAGE